MKIYIDLEILKSHLHIDSWYTADDLYLLHLIEVCQTAIEKAIDQRLETLEDEQGDIPTPLVHAIMLLCGTYYDDRESITHSTAVAVPHSFDYLIDLYTNYNPRNLKGNNQCNCNS